MDELFEFMSQKHKLRYILKNSNELISNINQSSNQFKSYLIPFKLAHTTLSSRGFHYKNGDIFEKAASSTAWKCSNRTGSPLSGAGGGGRLLLVLVLDPTFEILWFGHTLLKLKWMAIGQELKLRCCELPKHTTYYYTRLNVVICFWKLK